MARHFRSRTRFSRPLIAILGIVTVVGATVYYHNLRKSQAALAEHDRMSLKAVEASVLDVKPTRPPGIEAIAPEVTPSTLVTQTPPIDAPATKPANPTIAAVPATVPAAPQKVPATRPAAPATAAILAAAVLPGSHSLADAKAKLEAGDLLGARAIFNADLLSERLSAGDAEMARRSLGEISQAVFFSKTKFKDDPYQTVYQVQSGERLARIADKHGVTWELLCRINGMSDARKLRAGQWIKIPAGPFHCVITKSAYRLDVYLKSPGESDSLFVTSFSVGLGKDNSTPTGTWIVQQGNKAHPATYYSPRGEGVIAADDPKNPLGGYWMGLSGVAGNAVEKNSYGIHGTIEPNSIGKQASMGCIRLGHEDIALLYDLLVDGKSKIVVKD